jgi:hypothetical protein
LNQRVQKCCPDAKPPAIIPYRDADLGNGLIDETISRPICQEKTIPGSAEGTAAPMFSNHPSVARESPFSNISYKMVVGEHLLHRWSGNSRAPIGSLVEHAPQEGDIFDIRGADVSFKCHNSAEAQKAQHRKRIAPAEILAEA